jgi:hypothetical protein
MATQGQGSEGHGAPPARCAELADPGHDPHASRFSTIFGPVPKD